MFCHAWALTAWRFRKLMSLRDYIERGLALMLNPVLTARGKRKFAQAKRKLHTSDTVKLTLD